MTSRRLILIFAILVCAVIIRIETYEPAPIPPLEVIHTRGPYLIIPAQPQPAEDLGMMPLLALTLLQAPSGIAINGEIPLWGVFLGIIAATGAFFAVRKQMESHEKQDDGRFKSVDMRFDETNAMLKEIRNDIKRLIGDHASGD